MREDLKARLDSLYRYFPIFLNTVSELAYKNQLPSGTLTFFLPSLDPEFPDLRPDRLYFHKGNWTFHYHTSSGTGETICNEIDVTPVPRNN